MGNRRKRQPGPQYHAEGQHGEKTHNRFIEQLTESTKEVDELKGRPIEGHHRLEQARDQHDEAEKNSQWVAERRHGPGKSDESG